jgi:hypothetical protein
MRRPVIAMFLPLAACAPHGPAPAPPSPMRSPSQPAAIGHFAGVLPERTAIAWRGYLAAVLE